MSVDDSAVGSRRDQITDFDSRFDVINVRTIDANVTLGDDQAFTYIGGAAFSNTAGELRFTDLGADVIIAGDVNGDGVADFEIMLTGTGSVEANDFIL